jgi:hypothetical protein
VSPAKQKPADEMRFSSKEFDRIMGQVLQAKPKSKSKKAAKAKKTAKKRR